MKGLEYIINLRGISITDVGEKLGVARQNVHQWISGARKIPKKYLPILHEIFELPEELFDKEFSEIDKLKVQSLELSKEIEKSTIYIDNAFDEKSRKWVSIEMLYQDDNAINAQRITDAEIEALEVIENIKQNIFHAPDNIECTEDYIEQVSAATKQYKLFYDLRESNKVNDYTLKMILQCLAKLPESKVNEVDIENITEEELDNYNFEEEFKNLLIRKKKMDMFRQKLWNAIHLFDGAQDLY